MSFACSTRFLVTSEPAASERALLHARKAIMLTPNDVFANICLSFALRNTPRTPTTAPATRPAPSS